MLKKIRIYLVLGCLWVLSINICHAQKGLLLEFYEGDFQTAVVANTRLKDSTQAIIYLRNLTASKNKSFNWAYSIDSISVQNAIWKILVFPGFKFTSVIYKNTNLSPLLFNELLRNYKNQAPEEFARLSSKYLSTKGYPFAAVSFDSIQQKDNTLILKVLFKNATLVYFSKILNDNEILGISPKFLQDIIGIRLYDYFDLSKINTIPERIKSLGYFELTEQPNFIIEDSFCALKIPLREVKKNRFNGILGILPNSETSGELQFTGDVQLSLQNLFTRGIALNFNWQKLQPFSQSLNLQFEYPYLFHKPIHSNTQFKLLKQDTSFLTIDWKIGLGFVRSIRSVIEVSLQSTTSNLITIDTSFVNSKKLPSRLDFQSFHGGLNFVYKKTDQLILSRKGMKLDIFILAGYKKIAINDEVSKRLDKEGNSLSYLYNGISTPTFNAQIGFKVDYAYPIKQYFSLKSVFQSKILFSQNILMNENFRIGGNKILRGFDEENIYTPYYIFASEELRWFISTRSYMYSFVDIAMVKDNRFNKLTQDFPIGIGLGIALNTKGGIFAVSYAIGKQLNNSFDFRSSKIHFGYINEF